MGLGVNLSGIMGQIGRPLPSFLEDWNTLDAAIWDVTNPATGSPWTPQTVVSGAHGGIYCKSIPNALENAKLLCKQYYGLATADEIYIKRKLILEFEAKFSVPANISTSKIGISDAGGRGAVFAFLSGVLNAGTPYGNIVIPAAAMKSGVFTMQNKYRIEVSWAGPTTYSKNDFFINDVLVARCGYYEAVQPASIIQGQPLFDFTLGAGGACDIYIGMVRLWYKDV